MKKTILAAVAFSAIAATANADDFYGSINLGMGKGKPKIEGTTGKMKSSSPIAGDIAFGTYLNPNIRSELAFSLHSHKSKNKDIGLQVKESGMGGMLNFYYDLYPTDKFTPYFVAGMGYGKNKFKITGTNVVERTKPKSKGSFGYQAGLGVDFNFDVTKVGLGYRYRSFGMSKSGADYSLNGTNLKVEPKASHMLVLGARYDF
ncbi:adhesin/virulence factor [endosymbiont of Acanthamoeba sp. UWC8]|uniref:outer membrane protein n=1 Tax=endosymbiont of Acanthamoeba sp. UWC8 TaxID=86106 RepID=UPI0004D13832|nr:outer membrane beta-barrel protein [endosymbiont of Acanthamoeba sp. UWC8]AIF80901.1 adhesin/virulence factor [endosymbiont of Acanthamoeba sp. UWC8]